MAGARKSGHPQAIGLTRGALKAEILTVCGASGNPLHFVPTTGQGALADKADDPDKIVQAAQSQGSNVFRCVATGRDKRGVKFAGCLNMAGTVKWLR
ncbi:hypothetical protein [Polaromonas sp. CG_23.6]|uniref:hypothetical protein n=1 Tax=Polaromonas sp. CG_23.6 TaxID=2760709 RepID=UPI002473E505|nr:hypothetical protein [Polaromonas sp. CG_23.6]MDH6182927.1 hypothetical protein [Polaromonas sp. CG_23.6]